MKRPSNTPELVWGGLTGALFPHANRSTAEGNGSSVGSFMSNANEGSHFYFLVGFAIDAHSATHQIIHVNDNAPTGGDGTAAWAYNTIAAAVVRARVVGGDRTIKVEPGRYELESTITIDIPLDLLGSNVLEIDSNGWPTGVVSPGTETRIVGLAALGTHPILSVGRTDGVKWMASQGYMHSTAKGRHDIKLQENRSICHC
jgi:hypothetical protein